MDIPDGNGKMKKDPRRKYKYRVGFQGNKVVDENLYAAEFANLGSQPASMEASKMVDLYGCFPGDHMQQADATQAYIQAKLEGRGIKPTYTHLPYEAWPKSWHPDAHRAAGKAPLKRPCPASEGLSWAP